MNHLLHPWPIYMMGCAFFSGLSIGWAVGADRLKRERRDK